MKKIFTHYYEINHDFKLLIQKIVMFLTQLLQSLNILPLPVMFFTQKILKWNK